MKRRRISVLIVLALLPAFAVTAIACGGDSGKDTSANATATKAAEVTATATLQPATPTPTEVPPTDTPVPEPTATPEPPPPPSTRVPAPPAPSGGGTAPPPAPSGGGGGSPVQVVTASLLAFSPTTLTVPANTQVTITLQNRDAGVAHDIQVPRLGASSTCTGPCSTATSFNSGAPGSYPFLCSIHPTMTGTLIVR